LFPPGTCKESNWLRNRHLQTFTSKAMAGLALSMLIVPAGALDPADGAVGSAPNASPRFFQRITIGGCISIALIAGGTLHRGVKALLGPVMGASSVLFVMFRNDSAIKAEIAWA